VIRELESAITPSKLPRELGGVVKPDNFGGVFIAASAI
jgi:hypothetical protein